MDDLPLLSGYEDLFWVWVCQRAVNKAHFGPDRSDERRMLLTDLAMREHEIRHGLQSADVDARKRLGIGERS